MVLKPRTHKQLHTLEDDIIKSGGLLKALQALDCDDGAQISLIQALETQFRSLEQNFYKLWDEVASDDNNS